MTIAEIELLGSEEIQGNIYRIIKSYEEYNVKVKKHPKIKTTPQKGVIYALGFAIEMDHYDKKRYEIFSYFMKHGVCLRPLGKTI